MMMALPPAFAGLDHGDMSVVQANLVPLNFETGQIIIGQGEEDASVAFFHRGSADVFLDQTLVGQVGGRDIVGEMELFSRTQRLSSVVATSRVELQVLTPEAYQLLCDAGNPAVYFLERAVLRKVGDRLGAINRLATEMAEGEELKLNPKVEGLFARLNPFKRKEEPPQVDPVSILLNSGLFGWGGPAQLAELATNFTAEAWKADHIVCRQGEQADKLYMIVSGACEVVLMTGDGRAESVGALGPGQVFGDQAILLGLERTASVVTREDCVFLAMDRDTLRSIYDMNELTSSVLRQGLIRNLVGHIHAVSSRMQRMTAMGGPGAADVDTYKGTPVSQIWRG